MTQRPERGLRALLAVQGVVCTAIGMWGIFWAQMIGTFIGLEIQRDAFGLARLFGAAMLSLAIAYGLAAAQPHSNRSLLVPLFFVPLGMAIVLIANVAAGDVPHKVRAIAFALYNLAYCLLYFRVYPRVVSDATRPPSPST